MSQMQYALDRVARVPAHVLSRHGGFVAVAYALAVAMEALQVAEPGSDFQLAWAHGLIGATRGAEHRAFLRGLLDGSAVVDGLAVDDELVEFA